MRTPRNTYRLQVTAQQDLDACTELLGYLHDLGVDWVYLSPLLAAEPGSDHGYDVVDHSVVDASRGGPAGLRRLADRAHSLGMGVLVDIVPNHVGVATPIENPWWWSLLRDGRGSSYAEAFDVDWAAGGDRVRIPVVGDDDLGENGTIAHLSVVRTPVPEPVEGPDPEPVEGSRPTTDPEPVDGPVPESVEGSPGELRYHDHRFPLAPGSLDGLGDDPDPDVVHSRQHYRLVGWRTADDQLNYRRFFAVNTLAGIRVENARVFDDSHAEIRRWFEEGLVDGLRVDHPDGLRDPEGYLDQLRELTSGAYVLVEKILEPGEDLPSSWATAGTTGYDALRLVDRVLTDPSGQQPLDALEAELRGESVVWADLIHDNKRAVADGILGSEVRRIVRELPLASVPEEPRSGSTASVPEEPPSGATASVPEEPRSGVSKGRVADPSTELMERVIDAVAELLACFPVYRSYLPAIGRDRLDEALASAARRRPDLAETLRDVVAVLTDPDQPAALRFQQTSGMVMAKGVEDCAFYRFSRLTSLNEVGGDPSEFSLDVDGFHEAMAVRQRDWPQAMTTLSTHDTKRGEDVRARIAVLAEAPEEWASCLRRLLGAAPLPDPGFGSLLWQAILGAWPARVDGEPPEDLRARLHGYAEKAMREAGDRTMWTEPDASYEKAVHAAVDAAFDVPEVREVLDDLLDLTVDAGWSNALAAKLVALTMPGVPDVYQGSELWEQSLVDPDNRRPVDFAQRRELRSLSPVEGPRGVDDVGRTKLIVVAAALRLRRDHPELFTGYSPVEVTGEAAEHALAFDRGGAITVVTRLPLGLARRGGWGDTTVRLPAGEWRRVSPDGSLVGPPFTGAVPLAELLELLPVALLAKEA